MAQLLGKSIKMQASNGVALKPPRIFVLIVSPGLASFLATLRMSKLEIWVQEFECEYDSHEFTPPVIGSESVKLLLALAVHFEYTMRHFDINTTYHESGPLVDCSSLMHFSYSDSAILKTWTYRHTRISATSLTDTSSGAYRIRAHFTLHKIALADEPSCRGFKYKSSHQFARIQLIL